MFAEDTSTVTQLLTIAGVTVSRVTNSGVSACHGAPLLTYTSNDAPVPLETNRSNDARTPAAPAFTPCCQLVFVIPALNSCPPPRACWSRADPPAATVRAVSSAVVYASGAATGASFTGVTVSDTVTGLPWSCPSDGR